MSVSDWVQELKTAGYTPETAGRKTAAKVWGVSWDVARHRLARLRGGKSSEVSAPLSKKSCLTMTDSKLEVELPKTRINSLAELIKQFRVDTEKWDVDNCEFKCNSWEVAAVIDGKLVPETLYQVKAIFKPRRGWDRQAVKAEIARLVAEAQSNVKLFNTVRQKKLDASEVTDPLLAEFAIMDHHFGSLSWKPETGQANYDHRIAAGLYERAFTDLLERCTRGQKLDRILFVHGNDAINVNGSSGATAHGTPQVNDSRWQKMWESYWECTIKAINSALRHAPVDVVIMPGNHDRDLIWSMGHSLQCFYHGNKNVSVNNEPICRKYYRYGVNLIGLAHGDTTPLNKLPLLMATEAPELYAKTKRHEWHTGHLHHLKTNNDVDNCGIRVRTLPSLCPPNAWAVGSGYSRSLRASQAFLWHKERGLLDVKEHSIDFDAE